MYLFDTDAITNILKKNPSAKLVKNISLLGRDDQFISTITIGEIVYGSFKSNNPQYHLNNLKNILLPAVNILPFDSRAAFIYGKIRAELEKSGDIASHTDMQIASIAIASDLTLITGNIKHFSKIRELKVEDWIN
jgi:predicted nucleic acid-binding protein